LLTALFSDLFMNLYPLLPLTSAVPSGPKMVAVRNYHGTPAPQGKTPLCFQTGDFIELLKGDPDTAWWEVPQTII